MLLPNKRWKIYLLIIVNAVGGCLTGMTIMSRIHAREKIEYAAEQAAIFDLMESPKIYPRLQKMSSSGKPTDETDENVIRAMCLFNLGQIEAHRAGVDHGRPNAGQ